MSAKSDDLIDKIAAGHGREVSTAPACWEVCRVRCQQCQRVYSKPDNPDCPECGSEAYDDMPNVQNEARENRAGSTP